MSSISILLPCCRKIGHGHGTRLQQVVSFVPFLPAQNKEFCPTNRLLFYGGWRGTPRELPCNRRSVDSVPLKQMFWWRKKQELAHHQRQKRIISRITPIKRPPCRIFYKRPKPASPPDTCYITWCCKRRGQLSCCHCICPRYSTLQHAYAWS